MRKAAVKPGWTNRQRGKATKRDGTPCRRLAMTRHGLVVCGSAMSVIVGLAPGLTLPVRGASYLTGTTRPLTAEPRDR